MAVGRPSQYSPEVYAAAKGYIREGYVSAGDLVPTKSGLAFELGITRKTLYNWAENYPEFDDLMDTLMQVQERKLVNGGLGKEFDSAVARTLLAGHGYHSSTKVDHSSSDGSMNQQTVIILPAKDAE